MQDSKGNQIQIEATPFGKGGEGDTYRMLYSRDKCVKIYHPGKFDAKKQSKLEYMVSHPIQMDAQNQMFRICWPIDLVYENGKRVGFIMPLAFDNSHELYDIYMDDYSDDFKRSSKKGMTNRMKLVFNIALAIKILHANGCVLVDFKPQNILFTDDLQISVIDIDSAQINIGRAKHLSSAFTPEYAYPNELNFVSQGKMLTTAWDVFSFSIVAYHLLTKIHPFQVSTNATTSSGGEISTLDELIKNNFFAFGPREKEVLACSPFHYYFWEMNGKLQKQFKKTFDLAADKPSMLEWCNVLRDIIYNNSIEPNVFNQTPRQPIITFTNKPPKQISIGDSVRFEWVACYCKRVIIQNTDYSKTGGGSVQKNGATIVVPPTGIVEIMLEGKNATISQTMHLVKGVVLPKYAAFCTRCGKEFKSETAKFCTKCGKEREIIN